MSRYIYDVVLLLSSSRNFKFCENLSVEDNLNNTFCNKKLLQTTTAVWNCHKFNKKVSNSIYKSAKKIESPFKIKNDKTLNFCKWYR